jgi:hypothetical protein
MRWGNEKKSTVYKTGDERGLMRNVVNNQDVHKYTKMIRKYCSVGEMRIRGRGKTKQRVISPLQRSRRDNVKQGKTNKDKKEGT